MHRLLERQLRRQLGKDFQPDATLQSFLDIVDSYYHEVDKEQRMLQNVLLMNTAELNAVNERMRVQNAEMTRTLAEHPERRCLCHRSAGPTHLHECVCREDAGLAREGTDRPKDA